MEQWNGSIHIVIIKMYIINYGFEFYELNLVEHSQGE